MNHPHTPPPPPRPGKSGPRRTIRRRTRRFDRALEIVDRAQYAVLGITALLACSPLALHP